MILDLNSSHLATSKVKLMENLLLLLIPVSTLLLTCRPRLCCRSVPYRVASSGPDDDNSTTTTTTTTAITITTSVTDVRQPDNKVRVPDLRQVLQDARQPASPPALRVWRTEELRLSPLPRQVHAERHAEAAPAEDAQRVPAPAEEATRTPRRDLLRPRFRLICVLTYLVVSNARTNDYWYCLQKYCCKTVFRRVWQRSGSDPKLKSVVWDFYEQLCTFMYIFITTGLWIKMQSVFASSNS